MKSNAALPAKLAKPAIDISVHRINTLRSFQAIMKEFGSLTGIWLAQLAHLLLSDRHLLLENQFTYLDLLQKPYRLKNPQGFTLTT
jgi:hypothetical protein